MKLAKRILVFVLTVAMLVGCIPAFSVAAVEPAAQSESTTLTYTDLYVKDGLLLLSTVYGDEEAGNIDLSNGVWKNQVGDKNIAVVGSARAAGGYNGWWIGENGKGVGYNYSDYTNYNNNKHTWGMRLPTEFIGESDVAVEYVFDFIGVDKINSTNTEADGYGYRDGGHASFSFGGLFMTQFQASIGKLAAGMESRFHYGHVPFETKDSAGKFKDNNGNHIGPNSGANTGWASSWMLAGADDPATELNEERFTVRDGVVTMTINRDYDKSGEHQLWKDGKNVGSYPYAGFTVYLNGTSRTFINNQRRYDTGYKGTEGAPKLDTDYYSTADINAEGQKQPGKYTAFDAFFNFPAQVFAVRVYDRQLTDAEQKQNHFADIVGWFGNDAIDLDVYATLSNGRKVNVHEELADVSFNLTTADAVNAVIAKWAAMDNIATGYDKLYIQDGLALLVSAFGSNATVDLANGVWYNVAENGVTNVTINGTWTALENGGIAYTATSGGSHKNNYLSFNGAVDSLGDYTVEYYAKLQGVGAYDTNLMTQKFGAWGDWYFDASNYRVVYNNANEYCSWFNGYGCVGNVYAWDASKPATSTQIIDNEADASYRYYYYNTAVDSRLNGLNLIGGKDWKGETFTLATESEPTFWIARSISSEVYAIRAYDRALTAEEVKHNAAIDKLAANGVDVSALAEYDMALVLKTKIADAFDAKDVAEMQAIVDAAVAKCEKLINAGRYEDLYVQDGLNLLLVAYGNYAKNVDLENGVWTGLKDGVNGTIVDTSADISWTVNSAENGGGFTYKFANIGQHQNNKSKLGITLPADTIGDDDFTVETVFIPHYVGDGENIVPHSNNEPASDWGAYVGNHSNFAMGNIQLAFFQPSIFNRTSAAAPSYTGSSAYFRTMVCNGMGHESYSGGFCKYDGSYLLGEFKVVTDGSHNLSYEDKTSKTENDVITKNVKSTMVMDTTSFVVTRDVKADKSFTWTATSPVASFTSTRGAEYYAANKDCKIPFDMFYTFAATVYAIRAYDRVLSETEIIQNRVIDILAMNNIDVSELFAVTLAQREIVYNACAGLTYTSGAAEVQAAYDAGLAKCTFTPDFTATEYEALYVQNGLSAFYTVMDGGKTADVANGIWYNKLANDGSEWASLLGGKWTAMNNGVGYAMNAAEWDADSKGSNYINLGYLANDDFTVELVQTFTGLTNEDGSRYTENRENVHKWGYYATQYSSYEFGNFKGTSFVAYVPTAGSGNYATRVSFNPGHWGTDNGKYWLGAFTWGDAKYATVPVTVTFTQASGMFDREVPVLKDANTNKNVIEGVTYSETGVRGYDLLVYENGKNTVAANTVTERYQGAGQYNREIAYVDADGATQKGYMEYLSAAEAGVGVAGSPIYVMRNMPGTVYSIRVYDRALSVEETAQNHFADLATYAQPSLEVFNTLDEDGKQRVYDACVEMAFDTVTADILETVIAAQAAVADSVILDGADLDIRIGGEEADDLVYVVSFAANAVKIQALWDLGLNVVITGVATDETGKTYTQVLYDTSAANANDFTPDEFGMVEAIFEVAYTVAGLTGDVAVEIVLAAEADNGVTAEWVLDGGSVNFYDVAYYLVNELDDTPVVMHKYNTNELLVSIIGEENVNRVIELDIVGSGAGQESDIPAGEELPQGSTGSQMPVEGENSAAGSLEDKVALKGDATMSYTFTTDAEGAVQLLIEYVAKDHVLFDRGIAITVDGYETIADSLNDNYMGLDTNLRDHGYLVLVFNLGAGEHTITFATPDGMMPIEIYSVVAVEA